MEERIVLSALRQRTVRDGDSIEGRAAVGSVRRLGSAIGLVAFTLLDLLALDDITTGGAWMPEVGFVIASVPAMITMAYFVFRRPVRARVEAGHSRVGRGRLGR